MSRPKPSMAREMRRTLGHAKVHAHAHAHTPSGIGITVRGVSLGSSSEVGEEILETRRIAHSTGATLRKLPPTLYAPIPIRTRVRGYTTATPPNFATALETTPGAGAGGYHPPNNAYFTSSLPMTGGPTGTGTGAGISWDLNQLTLNDFFLSPPPPPPTAHALGLVPIAARPTPSPGPSVKHSRPAETHSVLSPSTAPSSPSSSSSSSSSSSPAPHLIPPHDYSLLSYPYPSPSDFVPAEEESIPTVLYSSSLEFRIGASGLAKERTPPSSSSSSSRSRAPGKSPPPPRPRSFTLLDITAPAQLKSVAVGEDAYFARGDSMCIADGVGGWARSGKGGADAGRWSRLLTHYCQEEVERWWIGESDYLERVQYHTPGQGQGQLQAPPQPDGRVPLGEVKLEGVGRSWVGRVWADRKLGMGMGRAAGDEGEKQSRRPPAPRGDEDDTAGLENGWRRRKLDPVEIMQRGFEKCLACVIAEGVHGSSTCLLALLHHSTLLLANLGDCALLLVRGGEVMFRTTEMQHAFNFPLQVGTHSRDEPMKDAKKWEVPVERGDIVVLGSDGLLDNLFDEDILDILATFSPPNALSPSPNHIFDPQKVSDALCDRARAVSEQTSAQTPFMERAIEEGIDFVGGKKDDITVIVGVVGEREIGAGLSAPLRAEHRA